MGKPRTPFEERVLKHIPDHACITWRGANRYIEWSTPSGWWVVSETDPDSDYRGFKLRKRGSIDVSVRPGTPEMAIELLRLFGAIPPEEHAP